MNDPEEARLERILRAGRPEEDAYQPPPLDSLLARAPLLWPARPSRTAGLLRGFGVVSVALAITIVAVALWRSAPPPTNDTSGGPAATSRSPSPPAGAAAVDRLLGFVTPWSGAYLGCGLSPSGETILVTIPAPAADWSPVAAIPVQAGRCDLAALADGSIKVVTAEGADPTLPTQVWTIANGVATLDAWASGLTVSALRATGERWTAVTLGPDLSVTVVDVDAARQSAVWDLPALPTSVGVVEAGYDRQGHRWLLGGEGRAGGVVMGDQGSAVVARLSDGRWTEKTFEGLWPVSLWFDREGAVVVVYDPSAVQNRAFRSADAADWEEIALPQDSSVVGVSGSGFVVATIGNGVWAVSSDALPRRIGPTSDNAFASVAGEMVLIGSTSGVEVLALPADGQ